MKEGRIHHVCLQDVKVLCYRERGRGCGVHQPKTGCGKEEDLKTLSTLTLPTKRKMPTLKGSICQHRGKIVLTTPGGHGKYAKFVLTVSLHLLALLQQGAGLLVGLPHLQPAVDVLVLARLPLQAGQLDQLQDRALDVRQTEFNHPPPPSENSLKRRLSPPLSGSACPRRPCVC